MKVSNNQYYVGVTVGPIGSTMSYSSAPGALWFASYLFSSLVRNICNEIMNDHDNCIFTLRKNDNNDKYYDDMYNSGVGVYHDRIYYSTGCCNKEAAKACVDKYIETAIKEIAESFKGIAESIDDCQSFLTEYFDIHYVIFDKEQVGGKLAKTLADALDSLELAHEVVFLQNNNCIQKIMQGNNKGGNNYNLKDFVPLKNIVKNIYESKTDINKTNLVKSIKQKGRELLFDVRSIEDIATGDSDDDMSSLDKTRSYYAIVYADGDNMGSILSADGGDLRKQEERISAFSALCTKYSQKSVDKIKEYGGVTIYAGGDDLLFLAPVYKAHNHNDSDDTKAADNIWELCRDIAYEFNIISNEWMCDNNVKCDENKHPSISFGVSINYYKYPLYEALDNARNLLFAKAKQGIKNNIAVELHKASGQVQGFVCCMETTNSNNQDDYKVYEHFLRMVSDVYNRDAREDSDKLLHSVLYHIESKKTLYEYVLSKDDAKDKITKLFINNFDYKPNDKVGQSLKNIQLQSILELIININNFKSSNELTKVMTLDGEIDVNDTISIVINMIRVLKFLVEDRKDG